MQIYLNSFSWEVEPRPAGATRPFRVCVNYTEEAYDAHVSLTDHDNLELIACNLNHWTADVYIHYYLVWAVLRG